MYWNILIKGQACKIVWININMRCIEMLSQSIDTDSSIKININMRCIEIPMQTTGKMAQQRLTLTWDVLKLF